MKFKYKTYVRVVKGFYKDQEVRIWDYDGKNKYKVSLGFLYKEYVWIDENNLEISLLWH